jgi:hypothetical protein
LDEVDDKKTSVLAVISFGYLLILISTLAFLAIVGINSTSSAARFDVRPIDGRTWVDWETEFAESPVPVGVTVEADYRLDMAYNFSILPIHVTVTNDLNVTIPSFEVLVLIEDSTGYIRGFGMESPKVSFPGERVSQVVFFYNVPVILRGQELRIHVISLIQQTLAVDKKLLLVRTFPNLEMKELPRILLFFLTFSTLPVSVFAPPALKKLAEKLWRQMLEKNLRVALLLIVLFTIGFALYWNYVCKVFSFL